MRAQRIEQDIFMEAVDLTGPVSFGHSWLGDGGNEVKICKAERLCLVAVDNDRVRDRESMRSVPRPRK
jgi:hypothetical protein